MSKKNEEEYFKDLVEEILKDVYKETKSIEKEMIQDTKKQLLKIIEQIETANDLRKFLIQSARVLIKDFETLIMLLENEDKGKNEN